MECDMLMSSQSPGQHGDIMVTDNIPDHGDAC